MTTTAQPRTRPSAADPALVRQARLTGLLYLGLAVSGIVGFLLIRDQLFVSGDPTATLDNLLAHPRLARWGVVCELAIVLTQALAALSFYRLFAGVNALAAGSLAAFGLVNAVAILASAALLGTALDVGQDAALGATGDPAATVQLLYLLSGNLWTVGGLFFGAWLIPMGWLALRSGWFPSALGWTLIAGGVGYLANTALGYLLPELALVDLLTLPATLGELWAVGYLLIRGVRPRAR